MSLETPEGKSGFELHFLGPLVEPVFGDYPDPERVKELRGAGLPPNIEVRKFFMKTADCLGNSVAQRHDISTNDIFVARVMLLQGINAIAQALIVRDRHGPQYRCTLDSLCPDGLAGRELGRSTRAASLRRRSRPLPCVHWCRRGACNRRWTPRTWPSCSASA